MRPWIIIGVAVLFGLIVVGVLITGLPARRAAADQEICRNNLKNLALFAAVHAHPPERFPPDKIVHEIPAGTIVLPGVPTEERLSWVVGALPGFDQRQQNTQEIAARIQIGAPWSAPANQGAARQKLLMLLCPGNPPEVNGEQPAPTQYVGVAGLGAGAATEPVSSPRAGAFRYDSPTPFTAITDGLSQTLLIAERSDDLGPWLRGGPATLRGIDDSPAAPPLIGAAAQFGGNHPNTSNWALADGSIRSFTPRIAPRVLFSLATIAGNEGEAFLE
jgi:hypothetical protein